MEVRSFQDQRMQNNRNRVNGTNNLLSTFIRGIQRTLTAIVLIVTEYSVEFFKDYVTMGFFSSRCVSAVRLDGKTAVITGCNTGIGKETAKDFFLRGAKVIMACRNLKAANEALDDIKKDCQEFEDCGELRVTELDLSSLESVRKCAQHLLETEERINLLINSAGVMMCPKLKTKDGYELQFGTNHLGHFLFTLLLLPKIIQSKPARIVTVSSLAHMGAVIDFEDINWEKKSYSAMRAYGQSKLANVLFSKELARRLKEANIQGINTYTLHPGVIATDLGRHLDIYVPGVTWVFNTICRPFIKTPNQGAQTSIYCAVDEKCENETGLYYSECQEKEPSSEAQNEDNAKKLWEVSCKLTKLDHDPFQVPQ